MSTEEQQVAEIAQEFEKLKKDIQSFMAVHNNPHDTCKHDEMAKKLQLIEQILQGSTPSNGSTGNTDQPSTDGNSGDLGSMKEAVEQARAKAKEALGTVEDLNAKQIKIADAEKAKVTAYVAKVDEFLKAYESADDAQKKAFDAANSGYVAEIKQSRDWNAKNFLPRTEGGGSDTGNSDNNNEDPNQGSDQLPPNPSIGSAVGEGAKNHPPNVKIVQMLLNKKGAKLTVDGKIGNNTIGAIERFQASVFDGDFSSVIEPNDKTWKKLVGSGGSAAGSGRPTPKPGSSSGSGKYFSHPNASKVSLSYGARAVKLNGAAEHLLKSILASIGIYGARLTSTLRTYHDQARITKTQTLPNLGAGRVAQWYGQAVLNATRRMSVADLAKWWENYDKSRGRVSSRHLSNQAMDVIPNGSRSKFANKVQALVSVSGSGVKRIIPKGVMGEPVDHVEFTFKVTG